MRKFLRNFFWSHGTLIGYLGSLSQKGLPEIFSKWVLINLSNPLRPPALLVDPLLTKNLDSAGPWCVIQRYSEYLNCLAGCSQGWWEEKVMKHDNHMVERLYENSLYTNESQNSHKHHRAPVLFFLSASNVVKNYIHPIEAKTVCDSDGYAYIHS